MAHPAAYSVVRHPGNIRSTSGVGSEASTAGGDGARDGKRRRVTWLSDPGGPSQDVQVESLEGGSGTESANEDNSVS